MVGGANCSRLAADHTKMSATSPASAAAATAPRRSSMKEMLSFLGEGYIYADRLASELREGDVMLFKGKQPHDYGIRCCTVSDYNHVALIVKNGGELELFEATAVGVACVPLEFFINSYYWSHMSKHFHKVVVRQLTTSEGRGIGRKLKAEFVRYQEEMLGRKFNLNPITYMQALLKFEHREDMSSVFCSQVQWPPLLAYPP